MGTMAYRGVAAIAAAVFFWSWLGVIGKSLYRMGALPTEVIAFRALVAWGSLFLALLFTRGIKFPSIRLLPAAISFGIFGVVLNYLGFYLSLRELPVAAAIVIVYSHPVLVVILARIFLREPIGGSEILGLAAALLGVFLVSGGYKLDWTSFPWRGVALALLTSVSLAVYSVLGKKLVVRVSPWELLFWALCVGTPVLHGVNLAAGGGIPAIPPLGWALILCLGLFPTLASYGLFLVALRYMRAGHASLAAVAEPVLAAVWAALFLGEGLESPQIIGAVLVLGASVMVLLRRLRHSIQGC